MTRILSLDTTSEFGSIALVEEDRVLEELPLHSPDGFSHVIFGQLEQLLSRHGWKLSDIDCFAAASGPGSFTGVRVGLAAVKGLAEATGKPVVPVSNLRALASFGAKPLRATLLDARRGEIYGAVYDAQLEVCSEEVVSKLTAWLAALPAGEMEFIAADIAPFLPAFAGVRLEAATFTGAPRALAAAIGRIGQRDHATGRSVDPAAVDANYVRRADAELLWDDPVPP
jgi:tRNA threonylcarbamoyladenosine biosynthesis protein TsaB